MGALFGYLRMEICCALATSRKKTCLAAKNPLPYGSVEGMDAERSRKPRKEKEIIKLYVNSSSSSISTLRTDLAVIGDHLCSSMTTTCFLIKFNDPKVFLQGLNLFLIFCMPRF